MKYSFLFALFAAALIAAVAIPSAAHHSFAAFDVTTQKSVTGTVNKVADGTMHPDLFAVKV